MRRGKGNVEWNKVKYLAGICVDGEFSLPVHPVGKRLLRLSNQVKRLENLEENLSQIKFSHMKKVIL